MGVVDARRILAATDFSETSDEAAEQGLALARASGGAVELVHVFQLPAAVFGVADAMIVASPEVLAELQQNIRAKMDERLGRARASGVAVSGQVLQGIPSSEIVRHARDSGADLIVLGTHGRSGFSHALLGSVAERVVQRASCPVLVIPHREARSHRR